MGVESIGTGLKTTLSISGLRVYAPNELPDSINELPAALILPRGVAYKQTFGDATATSIYTFRIVLLLTKQDAPSAFNEILDYIEPTGTKSLVAKVAADRTLNSSCDTSWVSDNLGLGTTNWGRVSYLSTEFLLEAYA